MRILLRVINMSVVSQTEDTLVHCEHFACLACMRYCVIRNAC